MELEIRDSFDPITAKDIEDFEKELGTSLPSDYRQFLLRYNGGFFVEEVVYTDACGEPEGAIESFSGLKTDDTTWDIRSNIRNIQGPMDDRTGERMPTELIPIGHISGGVICLGLQGDVRGVVFSCDLHDPSPDHVSEMADSFEAFLSYLAVDPDRRPLQESQPLFRAVEGGDKSTLLNMLAQGANVDARNEDGKTPLMVASLERRPAIVQALLDAGADVMAADPEGETALHITDSIDVTKLLLDHGADLNAVDANGQNALMHAIQRANTRRVRVLVRHGVDVNHRDNDGRTPADFCSGHVLQRDVLPILRQAGAKGITYQEPTREQAIARAVAEFHRLQRSKNLPRSEDGGQ